mmetsp:Transcript_18007/g.26534  ORF Transcript_18007/g.26534 Transcript_18007/m.26534 type:complete len:237 (+) Transcript_18007:39-749(+)
MAQYNPVNSERYNNADYHRRSNGSVEDDELDHSLTQYAKLSDARFSGAISIPSIHFNIDTSQSIAFTQVHRDDVDKIVGIDERTRHMVADDTSTAVTTGDPNIHDGFLFDKSMAELKLTDATSCIRFHDNSVQRTAFTDQLKSDLVNYEGDIANVQIRTPYQSVVASTATFTCPVGCNSLHVTSQDGIRLLNADSKLTIFDGSIQSTAYSKEIKTNLESDIADVQNRTRHQITTGI